MESEARDEAWASNVEWQLENFLALRPYASDLGSPTVDCRKTVCRVIATTEKNTLRATPEADWNEMMSGLQYETVSNEFARSSDMIVLNHSHPDRVGFVTYFERAR